jgi:oligopeptide/dipeptide ABC transporter ATP-binding protein
MCSRVYVMYLGVIVEEGPAAAVFSLPRHPYTQALLAAAPRLVPRDSAALDLKGELTATSAAYSGCPLRPRCPHATAQCREPPPVVELGGGHRAACWLLQ